MMRRNALIQLLARCAIAFGIAGAAHADNFYVGADVSLLPFIEQQAAYDLCPKHPGNCPTLTNGGLKIKTTIDMHQQAVATEFIRQSTSDDVQQQTPVADAIERC